MRTDVLLRDGNVIASTWQDVEPIIERNKLLQAEPQTNSWCRHVATIPNVFLVRWLNEEFAAGNTRLRMFTPEFNELVARKLRDPDWRFLRTDK